MSDQLPTQGADVILAGKIERVRLAAGNNQFTIRLCGELAEICHLALDSSIRAERIAELEALLKEYKDCCERRDRIINTLNHNNNGLECNLLKVQEKLKDSRAESAKLREALEALLKKFLAGQSAHYLAKEFTGASETPEVERARKALSGKEEGS